MDNGDVYNKTTEPAAQAGAKCSCTYGRLGLLRLLLKVAQLLLSFLAFICEEIVESCTQCGGLYFFEFLSCSAFLLSLLIMIVYCTSAYEKFNTVVTIDFWSTPVVGVLFFIASIVFAATSDKSSVETVAIVFGFLASIAFLIDSIQMFMKKRKGTEGKLDAGNTQSTPEIQPLNN
uniref:CKLF like MARVEL transmembrane domain containing 6 n=1 Tax=Pelusios castaneus TaxID=367368 RepID=A0A8C8S667_9SAUR